MSDEGFLKRWSRRKRSETPPADAPAAAEPPREPTVEASSGTTPAVPPTEAAPPAKDEEAVDPATLPPLESLGPDSDYTVFLKKGVPEALRLAALRKAWMSDPFIRDFRSPAIEYGWDFTTPDYALRPGDDVGKLLDQIFPKAKAEAPAGPTPLAPAEALPDTVRETEARATPPLVPPFQAAVAAKPVAAEAPVPFSPPDDEPRPARRKHGGALPDRED